MFSKSIFILFVVINIVVSQYSDNNSDLDISSESSNNIDNFDENSDTIETSPIRSERRIDIQSPIQSRPVRTNRISVGNNDNNGNNNGGYGSITAAPVKIVTF